MIISNSFSSIVFLQSVVSNFFSVVSTIQPFPEILFCFQQFKKPKSREIGSQFAVVRLWFAFLKRLLKEFVVRSSQFVVEDLFLGLDRAWTSRS